MATSEELHTVATRLSDLIVAFCTKLAAQPGHCKVTIEDEEFNLRFDRSGKRWDIWVDTDTESRLLVDSSLAIKMRAVELFPRLIPEMARAHTKLVEQVRQTTIQLEKLIGEL